jgi:hypothetical protein
LLAQRRHIRELVLNDLGIDLHEASAVPANAASTKARSATSTFVGSAGYVTSPACAAPAVHTSDASKRSPAVRASALGFDASRRVPGSVLAGQRVPMQGAQQPRNAWSAATASVTATRMAANVGTACVGTASPGVASTCPVAPSCTPSHDASMRGCPRGAMSGEDLAEQLRAAAPETYED